MLARIDSTGDSLLPSQSTTRNRNQHGLGDYDVKTSAIRRLGVSVLTVLIVAGGAIGAASFFDRTGAAEATAPKAALPAISASVIASLNRWTPSDSRFILKATSQAVGVDENQAVETATVKSPWPGKPVAVSLFTSPAAGTDTSAHLAYLVEVQPSAPVYRVSVGPAQIGLGNTASTRGPATNFWVISVDAQTGQFVRAIAGYDPTVQPRS